MDTLKPLSFTETVNHQPVKVTVSLTSYDANTFKITGLVPLTLTKQSNVEFTVCNDIVGRESELTYSIVSVSNEHFENAAKRLVKAHNTALEMAEYYYDLASQLRSPVVADKVILQAIAEKDFQKALLCILLISNCNKPLRHSKSNTFITFLIKDATFNAVISAIESNSDNKEMALLIMQALLHKADIGFYNPFVKPDDANEAVTPELAILNFVQAVRNNIKPSEITSEHLWCSVPPAITL